MQCLGKGCREHAEYVVLNTPFDPGYIVYAKGFADRAHIDILYNITVSGPSFCAQCAQKEKELRYA